MNPLGFSLKWCSDLENNICHANIIYKGAIQSYYKRKLWCTFERIAVTVRLTGHDNCVIVRCRTRSVRYSCWSKVYITLADASYTSLDVLRTPLSPQGKSFKSCRLVSLPLWRKSSELVLNSQTFPFEGKGDRASGGWGVGRTASVIFKILKIFKNPLTRLARCGKI